MRRRFRSRPPHSRARVTAARTFVAFIAAIAMLSAIGRGATRGYFCVTMDEMRDSPCCPRAHDADAPDRGIEAADCDCCSIAPAGIAPLAVHTVSPELSSTPLIALAEPRGLATAIETTGVAREHVTPPTGPPRQHPPRSYRTVFLL